jgi:hypothetical protein
MGQRFPSDWFCASRIALPAALAIATFAASSSLLLAQTAAKPVKPAPSAPAAQTAKPKPATAKPAAASPATAKPGEAPKPKAFTNEDVIKLRSAGFSDQDIVDAIEKAANKAFDTSADGLIAMANAGVSKAIIGVVLGRAYVPESGMHTPASPAPVTAQSTLAEAPTNAVEPVAPDSARENTGGGIGGLFRRIPGVGRKEEPQDAIAKTDSQSAAAAVDTSRKTSLGKLDKRQIRNTRYVEFEIPTGQKLVYDGVLAHYRNSGRWKVQPASGDDAQITVVQTGRALGMDVEIQTTVKLVPNNNFTLVRVTTERRRTNVTENNRQMGAFNFEVDRTIEQAQEIEKALRQLTNAGQ